MQIGMPSGEAHAPLEYRAAMKWLATLQARDTAQVSPLSRTRYMGHGARVERAIVLLHGYTSSPAQFHKLGAAFYDLGFNVLIPRAPHHGLADRLSPDQARLTAEELLAWAGEAIDIAQGLGEQVVVAGLSMGGVMAGWAAQSRPDVARAVLIAPACGFHAVPLGLSPLASALGRRLPNVFIWWDPRLREKAPGPQHAYPRYATNALAEILRLGLAVRAASLRARPAVRLIAVVTNANDRAVSNAATAQLVRNWRAAGVEELKVHEFRAQLGLRHDIVDPSQPEQRTDLVYPVLLDLISA